LLGYNNEKEDDKEREDSLNNAPREPNVAQSRSTADPYDSLSTKQLFAEVDRTRKSGDLNKASRMLEAIVARDDHRSSTISALFTLGKVERANSRHLRAANAFFKCYKLSTRGPLAEDALAEAALAWSAAKEKDKAIKAAQSYIDLYPKGIHAARMHLILE
jgi:TolA-binding protein